MSKCFCLIQGYRGLYYSDGNKIYFPDRSWKDCKQGVYSDMHITVDKGTYAFVTGNPVNAIDNDSDICRNAIETKFNDYNTTVFRGVIGDTPIFRALDNDAVWFIVTETGEILEFLCSANVLAGNYRNFNSFSKDLRNESNLDMNTNCGISEVDYIATNADKFTSREDFLIGAVRCISNLPHYTQKSIKSVRLIGDCVFKVVGASYCFYFLNGEFRITDDDILKKYGLTFEASRDEVKQFCKDKNICIKQGYKEPTVTVDCHAFGNDYEVLLFNGGVVTKDILSDEYLQKTVSTSIAEFDKTRKAIAKRIGRDSFSELSKFNYLPYALGGLTND